MNYLNDDEDDKMRTMYVVIIARAKNVVAWLKHRRKYTPCAEKRIYSILGITLTNLDMTVS